MTYPVNYSNPDDINDYDVHSVYAKNPTPECVEQHVTMPKKTTICAVNGKHLFRRSFMFDPGSPYNVNLLLGLMKGSTNTT